MTKPEAMKIVCVLFGSFPNSRFNAQNFESYAESLVDLDASACGAGVQRLIRTSKFLPSIAELRAACAAQTHGTARSGEEAYAELTLAVRRHGRDYGQGAPRFRDPLIAQCLGVWGSWNDLCSSPVDDPGGRARFIELYDELAGRERQDLAAGARLPAPARVGPRFWLERPRAAESEPRAEMPVAQLMAALAPRKAANADQAAPAARRWTADEIDQALAGGTGR